MIKMLRLIILYAFLFLNIICYSQFKTSDNQNTKDKFINDLLLKMTLEEKIGQLNLPVTGDVVSGIKQNTGVVKKIMYGQVGGIFNLKGIQQIRALQEVAIEKSRLKIPLLVGMDVIHGYETGFPIPLGLSATWDLELIKSTAEMAAAEASADGINWTFSPMVDISRDPRWGRVAEGSGEDPYLGSEIAKAMVLGYQGDLSQPNQILSCVKHFALYGASEAGRDYNTVDMSKQRMYNEYLPPYKAAIDAGAGSIMASFNDIDAVPATGNKWLLTDLLRNQWNFKGFVVSDYTGIPEMVNHGVGDLELSGALALNAGVDMDMVGEVFLNYCQKLLADKKITEDQINIACKRILSAKYDLGLFQNPYKYCDTNRAKKEIFTKEHRNFSKQVAKQSFVLLKNKNKVLPLKKSQTVAIIGPLANNAVNMPGTWSVAVKHDKSISVAQGMAEYLGNNANIVYAHGCNLVETAEEEKRYTPFGKTFTRDERDQHDMWEEATQIASTADVIIFAGGESAEMSGEASSRSQLSIPKIQLETLKKLKTLGKPIVLVLFTGRPLVLDWEYENLDAIINVWFPGTEAGLAIAEVLYGDYNPSGKLTMTFPKNEGQIPIYYAHKNTGRPHSGPGIQKFQSNYLDIDNNPLFPFGFGLSYTNFEYSNLKLSAPTLSLNDTLIATVTIENNGHHDGYEIVQLYTHDIIRSLTPPVKELKGFLKIFLKKGQSKTIEFKIVEPMLRFYDNDLNYISESGYFELMIGTNSNKVLKTNFKLQH